VGDALGEDHLQIVDPADVADVEARAALAALDIDRHPASRAAPKVVIAAIGAAVRRQGFEAGFDHRDHRTSHDKPTGPSQQCANPDPPQLAHGAVAWNAWQRPQ
jgi:hypothetical protein